MDAHARVGRYGRSMTRATSWRLRQPWVVDALTAAFFSLLVVVELKAHMDDGYSAGATAWNLPLLLGTTASLALRRSHTAVAIATGYAFVLVPSLFVEHTIFFFGTLMPMLVLTYTGARRLTGGAALLALLAPALTLVIVPTHQPNFDAGDYGFWLMLATIAVGLGTLMSRLDGQRRALEQTFAEQIRDQDLRERALLLDERARIARELHDVVAHAVSLMVVQAGAARLAVGLNDDEATVSLLAVESAGREALVDLRRLLSVLRPDLDAAPTPTPGLAMLPELVTRMEAAGLNIELETTGEPTALPAGHDLSAFRIVQEALTNALKHAGPTRVRVQLSCGESVDLQVSDDGPGERRGARRAVTSGHGLVGMRERAAVFGGTFEAGPDGNGWRVAARLPIPERHQAVSTTAP